MHCRDIFTLSVNIVFSLDQPDVYMVCECGLSGGHSEAMRAFVWCSWIEGKDTNLIGKTGHPSLSVLGLPLILIVLVVLKRASRLLLWHFCRSCVSLCVGLSAVGVDVLTSVSFCREDFPQPLPAALDVHQAAYARGTR